MTEQMADARLRLSPSLRVLLSAYSAKTGRTYKWVGETAILEWLRKQPEFEEISQDPKQKTAA